MINTMINTMDIVTNDISSDIKNELKKEYFDRYDTCFKEIDDNLAVSFKALDKLNWRIKELFILIIITLLLTVGLAFMLAVKVYAYEYTAEDVVSIGKVLNHEAKNESELGKRLVIDTILNRVESDKFPNTVKDVINQQGQYCNPKEYADRDVYKLIAEEIYNRTNTQVLWYRTKKYHSYGNPIIVEGNHYFSGF